MLLFHCLSIIAMFFKVALLVFTKVFQSGTLSIFLRLFCTSNGLQTKVKPDKNFFDGFYIS